MKILLSLINLIKDDQQKYQTLSGTMNNKMNIRCPSSITNSRSCTQDLKINSAKQWVDILDGIDAIAHKVKEISAHDLSACLHAGRACKQHCQVSKSTTRVNTTFDCSRSASKKRNEKYCTKNSKIDKKQRQCCTRNASSKIIKRPCNCQSRSKMKRQQIDHCCQSHVSQKRVIAEPICQSKCHEVMSEMSELKRINDELIRKNEELQKKLNTNKEESKYSSKQKIQREKANEIILRVIHEKQSNPSYQCQQNQSISVQLKPNNRNQYKSETHEDYESSETKLRKTLAKPQNIAIRIDSTSKKQQQLKQKTSHVRVLDISTQKYCPQASHNQSMMASQASHNLRKSRPSQLKSLETEFDRLMEISYLERNKARKRVIWGQMKSIANQLKLIRNFTQN